MSKYSEIDLTDPSDVVQVLKDRWFWCVDGDPKRGITYNKYSPQCNLNKDIAEGFPVSRLVEGVELIFVDLAFVPWDTSYE